jgi:hypothetical protein
MTCKICGRQAQTEGGGGAAVQWSTLFTLRCLMQRIILEKKNDPEKKSISQINTVTVRQRNTAARRGGGRGGAEGWR